MMKKTYPLFFCIWIAFTSCSQLSPTLVKSKYIADEVLRKLEFTQPYAVTTSTPVTFGEKIVTGDFKASDYKDTPWSDAKKGREFVVVEYADPKQKTEWGYLYQVYLWKDRILPFYVNRGDGMGLNLHYQQESQPYYRVNYPRDLYRFSFPTLVEPNQILNLAFMEKEWIVRKDKIKISSYVFNADESNGVELIARTEEPCRGNILITYTIKVIADDAWIAIDKTINSHKINCSEADVRP